MASLNASICIALVAENCLNARRSRLNSCNTTMPETCSCRKANVDQLEVPETLAAQVEHFLLSGPLHEIGLQEFEAETKPQQADVDRRNLRDPNQRSASEPPVKWRVRTGRVREVLVDRDL